MCSRELKEFLLSLTEDEKNAVMEELSQDCDTDDDESENGDDDTVDDDMMEMLTNIFHFESEPKLKSAVKMDRGTVDNTVALMKSEVGVQPIVAQPASGKTTVFPIKVEEKLNMTTVVVLRDDINVASAVVKTGATWINEDFRFEGSNDGFFYVSFRVFEDLHRRGLWFQKDVLVIFDEMQIYDEVGLLMKGYSNRYGMTNPVVELYGNYTNKFIELPSHIALKRTGEVNDCKRRMVIHSNMKSLLSVVAKGTVFVLNGTVNLAIDIIKECESREEYTLHVLHSEVIGLDISTLQSVEIPKYISVGNKLVRVDRTRFIQYAMRVGRRGDQSYCYFHSGKIPENDEVIECKIDVAEYFENIKRTANFKLRDKRRKAKIKRPLPGLLKSKCVVSMRSAAIVGQKADYFPIEEPEVVSLEQNEVRSRSTEIVLGIRPWTIDEFRKQRRISDVIASDYSTDELYDSVNKGSGFTKKFLASFNYMLDNCGMIYDGVVRYTADTKAAYCSYRRNYSWLVSAENKLRLHGKIMQMDSRGNILPSYHFRYGYG